MGFTNPGTVYERSAGIWVPMATLDPENDGNPSRLGSPERPDGLRHGQRARARLHAWRHPCRRLGVDRGELAKRLHERRVRRLGTSRTRQRGCRLRPGAPRDGPLRRSPDREQHPHAGDLGIRRRQVDPGLHFADLHDDNALRALPACPGLRRLHERGGDLRRLAVADGCDHGRQRRALDLERPALAPALHRHHLRRHPARGSRGRGDGILSSHRAARALRRRAGGRRLQRLRSGGDVAMEWQHLVVRHLHPSARCPRRRRHRVRPGRGVAPAVRWQPADRRLRVPRRLERQLEHDVDLGRRQRLAAAADDPVPAPGLEQHTADGVRPELDAAHGLRLRCDHLRRLDLCDLGLCLTHLGPGAPRRARRRRAACRPPPWSARATTRPPRSAWSSTASARHRTTPGR